MNKYGWIVVAIVAAVFGIVVLRDSDSPQPAEITVPEQAGVGRAWVEPEVGNALTSAADFELDAKRLYDIAYETDPALVAFAESIGSTPACVIAAGKMHLYSEQMPKACHRDPREQEIAAMQVTPGDEYDSYSERELQSLATTSPEAAVALARRIEDIDESERMYERAVALSGKPGPLVEWMVQRDTGGIERYNDVLNVEKAKTGYEINLVLAKFSENDNALAVFEEVLQAEGIPLEPIRAQANERFARLTAARKDLVGASWEG